MRKASAARQKQEAATSAKNTAESAPKPATATATATTSASAGGKAAESAGSPAASGTGTPPAGISEERAEEKGEAGTETEPKAAATATATAAATATATATEETGAEARLGGAATRPATTSRRTFVRPLGRPLGRPGKPMIAAAVVGGLVLIGVPFLISGPDDKPGPVASGAPAGSPMDPDGSGPGVVPGEQRAPDSGSVEDGGKRPGTAGTPARPGKGAVDAPGGIHEDGGVAAKGAVGSGTGAGDKNTDDAKKPGSPAKPTTGSTGGKSSTGKSGTGTGTGTGAVSPGSGPTSGPTSGSGSGSGSAQKPVASSTVVYTGVTGRGCGTPSGGGYQRDNYFSDGSNGWYARTSGGWTGDGCNGSFDAVPMSGDVDTDMKSRVKWWWKPGSKARTCQISVYIPSSTNTLYVGGHPTKYHVLVNANDRTTMYDSFTINQVGHRGQWVNAGTFAMKGTTIGVKLLDRGDDWSKGWEKAHHAAAQMRATCRS
ncbi:hypothetical protein ACFVQ4_07715 [Streptomyces laurentii]|uniref:hypothetical protein n=1 Tax=Streptomyces laurentii TaxID=39478 RepID=UPI00368AA23E